MQSNILDYSHRPGRSVDLWAAIACSLFLRHEQNTTLYTTWIMTLKIMDYRRRKVPVSGVPGLSVTLARRGGRKIIRKNPRLKITPSGALVTYPCQTYDLIPVLTEPMSPMKQKRSTIHNIPSTLVCIILEPCEPRNAGSTGPRARESEKPRPRKQSKNLRPTVPYIRSETLPEKKWPQWLDMTKEEDHNHRNAIVAKRKLLQSEAPGLAGFTAE